MKSRWSLISSIIQIVIGCMAIGAFIVLAIAGEDIRRWIVTAVLSVAFIVLGVIGLVEYKKQK